MTEYLNNTNTSTILSVLTDAVSCLTTMLCIKQVLPFHTACDSLVSISCVHFALLVCKGQIRRLDVEQLLGLFKFDASISSSSSQTAPVVATIVSDMMTNPLIPYLIVQGEVPGLLASSQHFFLAWQWRLTLPWSSLCSGTPRLFGGLALPLSPWHLCFSR